MVTNITLAEVLIIYKVTAILGGYMLLIGLLAYVFMHWLER